MKLKATIFYRLKYQLISLGIYYLYFLGFSFVLPGVTIFFISKQSINSETMVQSDLLFPALIFTMILAIIGARSDFKLCIQNGVSRFNIFLGNLITNFIISNVVVISAFLFKAVFDLLFKDYFNYSFVIVDQYAPTNMLARYLLTLVIIFMISSLGLLIGIFFDRFSNLIKLLIGAAVVLTPFLLGTIYSSLSSAAKHQVVTSIKNIIGLSADGQLRVMPLIITFLTISLINLVITYLLNRKRELQRLT
ncbi:MULTISPECIES: hypothetical protein [unclassified Enterococcus]|uniref:hypothetical protein n=1 Tax=unclassified Enterococcus TaxID=2608891 RepID=UPI0015578857|nr:MULTISPECIES: hypothetical protein [unclassified Enterococcus]MBS7578083.1 hypothetical protein [Enterococcus sp. MMGLQ5-2]MBS7585343.1 hypothetical protein [Enterococcus sp. MMGLQ5-1]NPD13200.1 hypothetical protein [Enterococcus sp. MMGLQ5-1]NPD37914.1 hypothetical protein [Enterococcus sp. MMGLQ5-2]